MVVLGLSQTSETRALRSALTEAGFSLDSLQIVEPDDEAASLARGVTTSGILTSEGATGVPGLTRGTGAGEFFRNESIVDRLADFGIPESELDNFVEALERGRTVVAYFAKPENSVKVADIFSSQGLSNVRQF